MRPIPGRPSLFLCLLLIQLVSQAVTRLEFDEQPHEEHASLGAALLQTQAQRSLGKQQRTEEARAPCLCQPDNPEWQRPAPRPPRCVFLDLGAADGNTFQSFLHGGYGPVENCPSGGSYEALLVEANPFFNKPLRKLMGSRPRKNSTGHVRTLLSTAAYMCEGTANFYLDTVDVQEDFWGSSMSPNTRDVMRSGKTKVSVPTLNVARLIMEHTLPEDFVTVKMDIEGSEWDILPCLAKSPAAKLIDALYVEKHPREWSLLGVDDSTYENAMFVLQQNGVYAPAYDSPM